MSEDRSRGSRRSRGVRLAAALALLLTALLVPFSAAGRVAGSLAAGAQGAHTYRNPVFAPAFPDPFVLRVGGAYYAYGTSIPWDGVNRIFPVLRSTDLGHWRVVADAMTSAPNWGIGDWWAPDVIVRRGTYYMFYAGNSLTQGVHCIGVATARQPSGPFTDHGSLACGDQTGQGYIDPNPYIDADGKAYLYLSVDNPYHSISVLPLSADLLHVAGPRRQLFTLSQAWEHGPAFSTVEGPFMVKRAGMYYLFYSGNDWQHDYAMGYATARSPLGPFTKCRRNPILRGTAAVSGPGGGSLFQDARGGWWLAYHAWPAGIDHGAGDGRNLRIDRVAWRNGAAVVEGPTTTPQAGP